MATIKNGLGENMKGRLGNVVFFSRFGRTYVRSCPMHVQDACTPLQQQQRKRMNDVMTFYKVVRQSGLAGIWREAALGQHMSGMNLFVRLNIPAFSGDGRVTDYEKLHFSCGTLPGGDRFQVKCPTSGSVVNVNWENATLLNEERYADHFMAVMLFENDEFVVCDGEDSGILRRDCRAVLRLPEEGRLPLRVYCFFAAADHKAYSGDVCCCPES